MNLQPDLKSNLNTDGRTDELTKMELAANLHLTAVDADARGPQSLREVFVETVERPVIWERHPVTRSGERDPIPPHLRSAVFLRDGGKCQFCGERVPAGMPWHLDHIKPWSAGGTDDSTNLRVLCERHNVERSNYATWSDDPRRAVTWWCLNCYEYEWEYDLLCPQHGEFSDCNATRGVRWALESGLPNWHKRPGIYPADQPLTLAYCAHCDAPGLTDVIL